MWRKLFEITSVDFDVTGQLLIIYSAISKILRKNVYTMRQCISSLQSSTKPTIQLLGRSYSHRVWYHYETSEFNKNMPNETYSRVQGRSIHTKADRKVRFPYLLKINSNIYFQNQIHTMKA